MERTLRISPLTHGVGGLLAALACAVALASCGTETRVDRAALSSASAQASTSLGSAGSFAVLAGTAVTCTDSAVTGDVGVWPGTAITQTNCTITGGTVHPADESAAAAYVDFLSAYGALALEECGEVLTGTLADVTLAPGVYCFDAAATLTGQLTLDGPSDGIWIFKIGTSGTGALTGTGFSVVMEGGGSPCNVYWWVAEAATMTDSAFKGTILAGAAITITGGTFDGAAMAQAAVTMTGANVSGCGPGTPPAGCKDFVTGGGWILLPDGSKGTFGVTGGYKHGNLWGHLTYVDHGANGSAGDHRSKGSAVKGMRVKGTGVTAYTVVDAMTRHIEGTAEINGRGGYTYEVDVVDAGEPGRDDMFTLRLSNGYEASGQLAGGNIQLHKKCLPSICRPFDDDDDKGEGRGWDHDWHRDGRR